MSFTIETEQNNKISLDVNVIREQGIFTTSVYQNQLSVVYTLILIGFYLTPTKLAWFTH